MDNFINHRNTILKRLLIIITLIASVLSIGSIMKITEDINPIKIIENTKIIQKQETKDYYSIGKLIIKKININHQLYEMNSEENTIEKNISILKESIFPDQEESIMILAAHSGEGKIAYFEELDQLEINDEIILIYKENKYTYKVKDIWEEKKNGYINVNKENSKQLILTTCSPKKSNYQLVVNCIEKESY